MTDTQSFSTVMERLRSGEDDAARKVFDRFARQLAVLVRRHFDRKLAHRVDPEDVVQSAFKSFFVRHRKGSFRLGDWDGLWKLLTLIARRKCVDRVDYLRADRRDVRREAASPEDHDPPWQFALDREPRPEEAAALAETVDDLYRVIDDDDRPILELSLQGYTAPEIGLRLGRALRSVQRLREQIRKRLERQVLDRLGVSGG
jgi:RNA polymerase sigma-70 factor (ECF subfamily)